MALRVNTPGHSPRDISTSCSRRFRLPRPHLVSLEYFCGNVSSYHSDLNADYRVAINDNDNSLWLQHLNLNSVIERYRCTQLESRNKQLCFKMHQYGTIPSSIMHGYVLGLMQLGLEASLTGYGGPILSFIGIIIFFGLPQEFKVTIHSISH